MRQFAAQIKGKALHPFSQEDLDVFREYKENQIVTVKIQGVKKPRSYLQLKKFFAVLRTVVANTEHPNWNSLLKAKHSLKVSLHYVHEGVVSVNKEGTVEFCYRSFSYETLPHMEACDVFKKSWPILAKVIGVSEDELLENVEL